VIVSINTSSAVPVYEQIRSQIAAMAESNALPAGTQLPSVRQLAKDLGIAPGTVAKAYQALDESGIASAHRRHGTVISDRATMSKPDRVAQLRAAAAAYAETARLLNVPSGTAASLVVRALGRSR
jgi:GntR family transcriptional regulator